MDIFIRVGEILSGGIKGDPPFFLKKLIYVGEKTSKSRNIGRRNGKGPGAQSYIRDITLKLDMVFPS